MEDATPEQLNKIQKQLTEKYEHKQSLFEPEEDPVVKKYVEDLWQRIVASKKLDIVSVERLSRMINADTMRHSNVREIGSEWLCHNSWNKLQLTQLLSRQGFSEDEAKLAATQVISRPALGGIGIKNYKMDKGKLRGMRTYRL